jgi:hypothetical protein
LPSGGFRFVDTGPSLRDRCVPHAPVREIRQQGWPFSAYFGITNTIMAKKRRGPGRPATGRDPIMAFRLPVEVRKQIDKWPKGRGLSRSERLRALIERGLKR